MHIQKSGKDVQYIDPLNVCLKLQHVFLQHILLHFPADTLAVLFACMLVLITGASNKCFGLAEFKQKGTEVKCRSRQKGERKTLDRFTSPLINHAFGTSVLSGRVMFAVFIVNLSHLCQWFCR